MQLIFIDLECFYREWRLNFFWSTEQWHSRHEVLSAAKPMYAATLVPLCDQCAGRHVHGLRSCLAGFRAPVPSIYRELVGQLGTRGAIALSERGSPAFMPYH